jgi:hypothetical protein
MEIIGIIVIIGIASITTGSICIYSYYNRIQNQNLENINLLNN